MAWNREIVAHAEGEVLRSVSTCAPSSNTPHQAGSKQHGGLVGVCAHFPGAVQTRGKEFPGAASLALRALRLTTLAKTQGGASRRPSVLAGPMLCVV